jgi:hypothetical protein
VWRADEPRFKRVQAELRWISENPIEDELRVIAGGGRIPSLEEVNARNRDSLLEAVIEAIERE